MPKAEIGWKRVTTDGVTLQVYARQVGGEWRFFWRTRRYEPWQPVAKPPLEDWLALLDALQRMIPRRRFQPADEQHLRRRIREHFPDAGA